MIGDPVIGDSLIVDRTVDRRPDAPVVAVVDPARGDDVGIVVDGTVLWTEDDLDPASAVDRVMSSEASDALLTTIGKARGWIDDLVKGRASSFAEIAQREGKVERHIRFLAPLAFVSPRFITAIIDGSAPADLTVDRTCEVPALFLGRT